MIEAKMTYQVGTLYITYWVVRSGHSFLSQFVIGTQTDMT